MPGKTLVASQKTTSPQAQLNRATLYGSCAAGASADPSIAG